MIPIFKPWITEHEYKYLDKAYRSGWISSRGEYIEAFEHEFAKYVNARYALSTSSGTTACHLMALAIELNKDDEVIMPATSFVASANSVAYTGAKPIFADIDNMTWNIDTSQVESLMNDRTKAIMPVDLYGNMANYNAILKHVINTLSSRGNGRQIYVIADACESLGCSNDVLEHCDMAAYSFYGNKIITTGEGGMLVTNSLYLYMFAKKLRGQGETSERYYHDKIGYNYRMTNLQAAIGLGQLERIGEILKEKARVRNRYFVNLFDSGVEFQHIKISSNHWSVVITHPQIHLITQALDIQGIETRKVFRPLNHMPMYDDNKVYYNAEFLYAHGLCLPSYAELEDSNIDMICDIIRKVITE